LLTPEAGNPENPEPAYSVPSRYFATNSGFYSTSSITHIFLTRKLGTNISLTPIDDGAYLLDGHETAADIWTPKLALA
jgi:hypothetical protein